MSIIKKDELDRKLVSKYKDIKTVLKENYKNKEIIISDNDNEIVNEKDEHPCVVNYEKLLDDIRSIWKSKVQLGKYPILKYFFKTNDIKDIYSNPNYVYERYGVDIILIVVGKNLSKIADPSEKGDLLPQISLLRVKMTDNLGYLLPNIRVMDSNKIEPNEYRIYIRNKLVHKAYIKKENITNEDAATVIDDIEKIALKYVKQIMTKTDVIKLIELVRAQDPTLTNDLVPIFLSPIDLKHIFCNLIKQNISIKDIIYIFELLNDYARYTNNIDILTAKLKEELSFNRFENI